jgi:16S rRNA (uracil1498-N3)-methyltransferase
MQLFYSQYLSPTDAQLSFSKEESRHIAKVLRKQIGDILHLTNGKGDLFTATLLSKDPKCCLVAIANVEQKKPLPYSLHLAISPTKLNDRFEWFLEKATEIGITQITPILCQHSERKIIKPLRYQKIILSAAKQSLKYHFPELHPICSFKDFLEKQEDAPHQKLIAHCQGIEKKSLKSLLKPKGNHIILVGPEGDFSSEEITLATSMGYTGVSLGENRLRTETAAIVACHSVAYSNEVE